MTDIRAFKRIIEQAVSREEAPVDPTREKTIAAILSKSDELAGDVATIESRIRSLQLGPQLKLAKQAHTALLDLVSSLSIMNAAGENEDAPSSLVTDLTQIARSHKGSFVSSGDRGAGFEFHNNNDAKAFAASVQKQYQLNAVVSRDSMTVFVPWSE